MLKCTIYVLQRYILPGLKIVKPGYFHEVNVAGLRSTSDFQPCGQQLHKHDRDSDRDKDIIYKDDTDIS